VALAFHALLATYVLSIPPRPTLPAVPKAVDRYANLEAIREKVELPKPEPPKPPEPPPKEPEVAEAPKPKPKPKRKRRKGQPKRNKPAAAPKEKPQPEVAPEPAPLVLSHVNMTGGVAVQAGEEDIMGDPSVAATSANTRPPPEFDEPAAPPKRVPPKVIRRAVGIYPADAPRLGRVVEVTLRLQIDEEGRVSKIFVVKTAGTVFDQEARRTARRLRFRPGTIGDVPSPMWVPWVVAFEPAE